MQEIIEYIVKKIVERESEVAVKKIEEGDITTYSIKVDPADAGKVIGKRGKTINSLKKLINLYLHKTHPQSRDHIYLRLEEEGV